MLNLTSKIQTYIIYGLASFLIAVIASHAWVSINNKSLKVNIDRLELEVETIEKAEKSCKKTLTKLITNNRKKSQVLQRYKSKIKGVEDEKINTIDSFINFADRLQ